jgi:hypothetical protein
MHEERPMSDRSDREESASTHPKPVCRLIGEDGSVFDVIGRVRRALKNAGQIDRAREFVERAFAAKSYDEVLALAMDFVEVR